MEHKESTYKKVSKANEKFEDQFEFDKMETMIHRFPAGLRDGMSNRYPYMVVPRFVAIGPYHHGKKHLEKMEDVKKAAAHCLCGHISVAPEKVMQAVRAVVEEARVKYCIADDESTVVVEGEEGMMNAYFADMMFHDACFLLLYMDFYNRSYGKNEDDSVNKSMRRFLFSNRDSIDNDIMLLENQLPWLVIQSVMCLAREKGKRDMYKAVGEFIAAMGNPFKIRELCQELVWDKWDDENNPPAHLLALLRRHKTQQEEIPQEENRPPQLTSITAISPMNLEEIGIKLAASQTEKFTDMGMEKGWLWAHLTLAPLSLSNTRASCLVNMAAFEVCTASRYGDDPDRTAVCSYLAFLAFFMVGRQDVRSLQSKGLLLGPHSDDDMLVFFKTVVQHLPDYGKRFSFVMAQIQEYRKNRPIRTTLYKWLYNNYVTIIKVVTVLGTLIGLYQKFLSQVQKTSLLVRI